MIHSSGFNLFGLRLHQFDVSVRFLLTFAFGLNWWLCYDYALIDMPMAKSCRSFFRSFPFISQQFNTSWRPSLVRRFSMVRRASVNSWEISVYFIMGHIMLSNQTMASELVNFILIFLFSKFLHHNQPGGIDLSPFNRKPSLVVHLRIKGFVYKLFVLIKHLDSRLFRGLLLNLLLLLVENSSNSTA